jgi:fatty acid desaturase
MIDQALTATGGEFSLRQARHLVRDLFEPRAGIYWCDFLTTVLLGHLTFSLSRRPNELLALVSTWEVPTGYVGPLRIVMFFVACVLYYRAVNFIHEVIHLPSRRFWLFKATWNLLCGIPFLTPSFAFEGHLDHHRRRVFGTTADGEYLALGRLNRWWILAYLSQSLWGPPLTIVRFGVLTPASWLSQRVRDWVHQRFSSLVMDPRYLRPLPTAQQLWAIRVQEGLCFALIVGACVIGWQLGIVRFGSFLLQVYALGAIVILLNCLRTLGAHRFRGDDHEHTLTEQLLDSVNLDSSLPWDVIIAPVGMRYHATHHLFPGIPYHNLQAAHRRLMAELPADSIYRQTVEPSLFVAIWKLCQRAEEPSWNYTIVSSSRHETLQPLTATREVQPG